MVRRNNINTATANEKTVKVQPSASVQFDPYLSPNLRVVVHWSETLNLNRLYV
jgi:hypothetical protein